MLTVFDQTSFCSAFTVLQIATGVAALNRALKTRQITGSSPSVTEGKTEAPVLQTSTLGFCSF